jgi:uncharacterized iron-regulated membrane protein
LHSGARLSGPRKPHWLRRALFQVHLWGGIGLSLYILVICVSGSAIVFRRELNKSLCPTGCEPHFVSALAAFHDDLSSGRTGRWLNGLGAIAVTLLAVSGAILWWPGAGHLRRGMTVRRHLPWPRFVRELHGALGFWSMLLVLLWAVTGIYFAFPGPFNSLAEALVDAGVPSLTIEDDVAGIIRLHFGRAFGHSVEALWVVLGLLPATLVVTGVIMWWHRVLAKAAARQPASGRPQD